MERAYKLFVDGASVAVRHSLEDAKESAQQYIAKRASLKIVETDLDVVPRTTTMRDRTWTYDHQDATWVASRG
jgi:spore maturation protein CgeB